MRMRMRMPIHMVCVFLIILWSSCCLSDAVLAESKHTIVKLNLPSNVIGPEDLAFDSKGQGPYTGVQDGRILKYVNSKLGFVDFASTSPNRTKKMCDGVVNASLGQTCGRPLGIAFNYRTGDLYMVDIYKGLLVVGPKGGLATQLFSGFRGKAFEFTNAIDLDPSTGVVYFTDSGAIFGSAPSVFDIIRSGNRGGRLFKYDPRTKEFTVLLTGLSGANGLAISRDRKFLVVSEYIAGRIRRYWLKGPKAHTSEVLLELKGHPDNIRRTKTGDFWVAMLIVDMKKQTMAPFGQRFSPEGIVLETVDLTAIDPEYKNVTFVSEIQVHAGRHFVGCPAGIFVDMYW